MPENHYPMMAVPGETILMASGGLPASSSPSYLKIWFVDPASGEPVLLSLGRWAPGTPLAQIQPPKAVQTIYFELFNDAGTVSGEWRVS